jgi:hypothetical protein
VGTLGPLSAVDESIGPVWATAKAKYSVIGSASTTLSTPFVVGTFKTSRLKNGRKHGSYETEAIQVGWMLYMAPTCPPPYPANSCDE